MTWSQTTLINQKLDVLFVVDDTNAVAGIQDTLASAYPRIAQIFQMARGGLPSIHVGVAAASVGLPPNCEAAAGGSPPTRVGACGLTSTDQFLSTNVCGENPDFTGSFTDELSCLTDFGIDGCGPAQPLTVVREVLDAASVAGSGWSGFLRPDAYLLLVIVAGQDDASGPSDDLADVAALATRMRALKADPTHQILVSAIDTSAICAGGSAIGGSGAPRLSAFAEMLGDNVSVACTADDLVAGLAALFGTRELPGPKCMDRIRDTDPSTPGLQADCSVDDAILSIDGAWSHASLPSCAISAPPCWSFTVSPDTSGGCAGKLLLDVDRGPGFCPQSPTSTLVSCLSCVDPGDPACQTP